MIFIRNHDRDLRISQDLITDPENGGTGSGTGDLKMLEAMFFQMIRHSPLGCIVYKHLDHNGGISYNTNECYKLAAGDYIGLFDQDDIIHPSVLFEYVKAINEQGADYLYCDETTFKENDINKMLTMHFKPDYAPDNLRANNYICHFSVFSRKLLEGEELFRTAFDGAQDHDMILRLTDRAQKIVHVPRLMYYWRSHEDRSPQRFVHPHWYRIWVTWDVCATLRMSRQ